MKFVDEVRIKVESGRGGNGCVSFRREKYVPRGGPDGGDGGKGGDIVIMASAKKHTLLDFRYRHRFVAKSGGHGRGSNQHGRNGEDLILEVPCGTLVRDPTSLEIIADLRTPGEYVVAAKGGQGGKGNAHFVSSVRRAPKLAQPGQEGEQKELLLELKLIADVGLVGFPNAGKSTLISVLSAARPKIADYPFTTLVPNLGVVSYGNAPPFVMADIPGLIEGAHEGVGLGSRFLRHIERTSILLHLIDVTVIEPENPLGPFLKITDELAKYSNEICKKKQVIALNKMDLISEPDRLVKFLEAFRGTGYPVTCISALHRQGLQELLEILIRLLFVKSSGDSFPDGSVQGKDAS